MASKQQLPGASIKWRVIYVVMITTVVCLYMYTVKLQDYMYTSGPYRIADSNNNVAGIQVCENTTVVNVSSNELPEMYGNRSHCFDVIDSSVFVNYSKDAIINEAENIHKLAQKYVHLDSGPCESRLPQCLIVGNFKCGTRELIDFMSMHPRIKIMRKPVYEIQFFNKHYAAGLGWYRKYMPCSYKNQITVEKSPEYFHNVRSPMRIRAMNSSVRLIVLVREPVARTVSHFTFYHKGFIASHRNLEDFVIDKTTGDIKSKNAFVKFSVYDIGMARYLRFFNRSQIKVIDSEDFKRDPYSVLHNLEMFLNLEHTIQPENFVFNKEKGFFCLRQNRSSKTASCYRDDRGRKTRGIEDLVTETPDVFRKLAEYFKPHNERFFQLAEHVFDW